MPSLLLKHMQVVVFHKALHHENMNTVKSVEYKESDKSDLLLLKRCKVNKAKKLLSILDDLVKSKHQDTTPAYKAKA